MLIQFKVSNYRSIAEEQTISLLPSTSQSDFKENIIKNGKHQALNSIGIYGPNSSGKSNLLKSLELFDRLIYLSAKSNSTTRLPYDPNILVEGYAKKPTTFEITFILNERRYRYGVEFNYEKIITEWLFRKGAGREVEVFYREEDIIQVSSGFEGAKRLIDTAIEATRNNALFLSVCDMFNITEAKSIFGWFENCISIDGLNTIREEFNTMNLFEYDENFKTMINKYLKNLDLGFEAVTIHKKEFDPTDLPDQLAHPVRDSIISTLKGQMGTEVQTIHKTFQQTGETREEQIVWSMDERESAGTKKAFQLSGPIIYTLVNGGVLVIDEIEARLHTKITLRIVDLFLKKETNPNNAQLIFATHDTNLLKYSDLRRDQINFVDKNAVSCTEVYSLSDFRYFNGNKERPDSDKEKRYLEDRYGATPNVNLSTEIFNYG